MKIGVVSDTHSKELPQQMLDDFKNVDLILHLGDHCDLSVYETFSQIQETKAVFGNMDGQDFREKFPEKQILDIGQYRIGMFHGEGPPKKVLESVQRIFKDDKIDVAFGSNMRQGRLKVFPRRFSNHISNEQDPHRCLSFICKPSCAPPKI